MEIRTYRNKRNHNKYIEVKRTNDRHYMWQQYMYWKNAGVKNYTLPAFYRIGTATRKDVLDSDYELIEVFVIPKGRGYDKNLRIARDL